MQITHLFGETNAYISGVRYDSEGGIDCRKWIVVNKGAILGTDFWEENSDFIDGFLGEFSQDNLDSVQSSQLAPTE